MTRTCRECGVTKPECDFAFQRNWCKSCNSSYNKRRYQANVDAFRKAARENRRRRLAEEKKNGRKTAK